MNIFYLDKDPGVCASMHCDKHVVKMILELGQLLSTAHRVLDGTEYIDNSSGRRIKRWKVQENEDILYKATHVNHPSAVWVRESNENYLYTFYLFEALSNEFLYRYTKVHKTYVLLREILSSVPENIPHGEFTEPPQAMPEYCRDKSSVNAYRKYYLMEKSSMLNFTRREIPDWIKVNLRNN